MGARRLTRATVAIPLAIVLTSAMLTGPSAAGQPPASLEEQIAAADAELEAAQARLADTFEAFAAADDRYRRASVAADAASETANRTHTEATAAAQHERDMRLEFDEFAAASFRQRSSIGSIRAYLGASSPSDLLDRASMMNVLSARYGDVLAGTRQAAQRKSAADREARTALDQAERDRDAAARAKTDAERAYRTAVDVQDEAKAETAQLAARRASLAAQSSEAENTSPGQSGQSGQSSASGAVVLPAQGRLTSTYGARGGSIHFGIDIANSIGTPILSAMAGEVIDSGPASGFGLWVRVQHGDGLITVYGHINESLVNVGQQVGAGEQIATLGNRGQSTGPHLHFEVHQNGNKIDPLPWLRSHGVNI
jgi:murein DD-endopeptidase MepM/ murein hydrolase activator NlpD